MEQITPELSGRSADEGPILQRLNYRQIRASKLQYRQASQSQERQIMTTNKVDNLLAEWMKSKAEHSGLKRTDSAALGPCGTSFVTDSLNQTNHSEPNEAVNQVTTALAGLILPNSMVKQEEIVLQTVLEDPSLESPPASLLNSQLNTAFPFTPIGNNSPLQLSRLLTEPQFQPVYPVNTDVSPVMKPQPIQQSQLFKLDTPPNAAPSSLVRKGIPFSRSQKDLDEIPRDAALLKTKETYSIPEKTPTNKTLIRSPQTNVLKRPETAGPVVQTPTSSKGVTSTNKISHTAAHNAGANKEKGTLAAARKKPQLNTSALATSTPAPMANNKVTKKTGKISTPRGSIKVSTNTGSGASSGNTQQITSPSSQSQSVTRLNGIITGSPMREVRDGRKEVSKGRHNGKETNAKAGTNTGGNKLVLHAVDGIPEESPRGRDLSSSPNGPMSPIKSDNPANSNKSASGTPSKLAFTAFLDKVLAHKGLESTKVAEGQLEEILAATAALRENSMKLFEAIKPIMPGAGEDKQRVDAMFGEIASIFHAYRTNVKAKNIPLTTDTLQ